MGEVCTSDKFCRLNKSEGMDVLKVVQQLRDLAADPQNRATIVRVSVCVCLRQGLECCLEVVKESVAMCLYGENSYTCMGKANLFRHIACNHNYVNINVPQSVL